MTKKLSSCRTDKADTPASAQTTPAHIFTSPRLDPNFGPAFFGTATRSEAEADAPERKIDAQEFWRRLDP